MKTSIKLLVMATIMLLAMGVTTSCSSDEDFLLSSDFGELSAEDIENIEIVNDFLNKTFPNGTGANHAISNYKGFDRETNDNKCYVMNSNKELESIYIGDDEIPKIDFSKISIILCRVLLPSQLQYTFENYSLENSKDETLVTLNFSDSGAGLCALSAYYFHVVVPKFKPGKTIRAEAKYTNKT